MLNSFTLKNFKSFKEATLKLAPTVTFLIGANGSGKSNALEALRFISWQGQGMNLNQIEQKLNAQGTDFRGKVEDVFRDGTKNINLSFNISEDTTKVKLENLLFELSLGVINNKLINKSERLFVREQELYNGTPSKAKNKLNMMRIKCDSIPTINNEFMNDNQEFILNTLSVIPGMKYRSGYDTQANIFVVDSKPANFYKALEATKKQFSDLIFLNVDPILMRNYVSKSEDTLLHNNGANLSAALFKLCQDKVIKEKILDMIRSLPEQNIDDIQFIETTDNDVRLALVETFGKKKNTKSTKLLSDGTLRALAIAAALYGAPEGSLVVIEEVDNGIHPSRIKHLVDKMYEIAAERHIQILVTTHDPAMMDAIPPKEKGNVLCCYRSKEDGTSKILRLQDSPDYMDFVTNGRLGSFVATELFETLITRTAEEREKEHREWFEQFKKEQDEYSVKLRQAMKEE